MVVLAARDWALWKVRLRPYFLIDDATIDRDIGTLHNQHLLAAFRLYSILLLGFIPVALQKVFRRVSVGVAVVVILSIPSVWYGFRLMHVAGKMVDWPAAWRDSQHKVEEAPSGH
jgi:hypothetical protein